MGISATQGEDVAAPGGIVSGAAGTGQEHTIAAAPETAGCCRKVPGHRGRVVIGLGVLAPEGAGGGTVPEEYGSGKREPVLPGVKDPGSGEEPVPARLDPTLAFALYERDERIAERLGQKIARLEKRLAGLEERGRSP